MIGIHQITCPQCITPLDEATKTCPTCGLTLPPDYFKTCDEAPPLPIIAVGFKNHGKTHLLAALLLTIEHLSNFSLGVSYLPHGEHTLKKLREWRRASDQKRTLEETPFDPQGKDIPAPLIVSVEGIYNPRTLLIYDVAGEAFQSFENTELHLPALQTAQTIWFVVSANDFQVDEEEESQAEEEDAQAEAKSFRPGDLFSSYLSAMQRLGASLEGRNAIIVLTKGDKFEGVEVAKPERDWLPDYLESDPFANGQDGRETVTSNEDEQKLEANSSKLEKLVRRIPFAGNLIERLKKQKMNVRFCVVSALGADQNNKKLLGYWKRQRVLDPLFWTLSLEKKREESDSLHLVLDAAADSDPAYAACGSLRIPGAIWGRLAERREVRIWLMGQSLPPVPPRRPPPDARPHQPRPRLIGPLLEGLSPKSRVIVLTQGVILDLEDFRTADWNGRLLLVCTSDRETVVNCWDRSHTIVFRSEQDLDLITSQVQRMF